jgi:hypothetical protein
MYGVEFGSVTLKRIGFFVFQLNTQHNNKTIMIPGNIMISGPKKKGPEPTQE